jgi:ZIP family zinc transporter
MAGALALAIGLAIQNIPEGAIISLPLRSAGNSRKRAFAYGTLSGIVEPIAAILTIVFIEHLIGIFPYMLAFAAGAMIYVVVEELIPESHDGRHSNAPTIAFAIGFALMMVLDVALG